jgi:hypothetical protein
VRRDGGTAGAVPEGQEPVSLVGSWGRDTAVVGPEASLAEG